MANITATQLSVDQMAQMIDHTFLKAYAQEADLQKLCDEARAHHFRMVAINSVPVAFCHAALADTDVHVGAAISFPLGQTTIATKVFEATDAIKHGADEIDYVLNIGKLKDGDLEYIRDEMQQMVTACHQRQVLLKVILETCYLTDEQKRAACAIAREVRPDFVKTSTGFGTAGATVADVALMKAVVGDAVKVKAAGGIRDLDTALAMINAGAERIGTSHGVAIVEALAQAQQA
ncbi:MAG: deoxyribose-phosphate aldolase [Lactobacillus sp.]|jgi:deoxyribose-phosphate aldolase|nr:deoxyribose-phosphate aldolase [Lactobacillus sp.]MCI2033655.1 deoxyribose-phosphate aldolase [Lactobacillus sp.]